MIVVWSCLSCRTGRGRSCASFTTYEETLVEKPQATYTGRLRCDGCLAAVAVPLLPQQEEQRLLESLGPENLTVLVAIKHKTHIVVAIPALSGEHTVNSLLVGGIAGINVLGAAIHIHPIAAGIRQVGCQILAESFGP